MADTCTKFESDVKYNFGFLLESDFDIIHNESSSEERCLLIMESDALRVKFYRAIDEVNLLVGNVNAPLIWDVKKNGEISWYYIREIIGFITRDLNVKELIYNRPQKHPDHDQQLIELSQMLKDFLPEIKTLFDQSSYENFKKDIRDYQKEYKELFDVEYRKFLES